MSDYEDDFIEDFDYFYVEDAYDAADNLAEHAVASPGPVIDDAEDENGDWDRFDYWADIEYDSDGYHDVDSQRKQHPLGRSEAGKKRKSDAQAYMSQKKRKIESGRSQPSGGIPTSPTPLVLWRSRQARNNTDRKPRETHQDETQPFALLKDWKEKFEDNPGLTTISRAASVQETASDDMQDDDYDSEADVDSGEETSIAELEQLLAGSGLDPENLRAAMQRALASTGADGEGMDASVLLKYAARMLANEDTADDIAGELADDILSREVEDGEGGGFSEWISRQVQAAQAKSGQTSTDALGAETDKPRMDSIVDNAESPPLTVPKNQRPPTPASTETGSNTTPEKLNAPLTTVGQMNEDDGSPRTVPPIPASHKDDPDVQEMDGTAAMQPAPQAGGTTRGRKRTAAEAPADAIPASKSKRPARSYEAPTATSKAKATAPATRTVRDGKAGRG